MSSMTGYCCRRRPIGPPAVFRSPNYGPFGFCLAIILICLAAIVFYPPRGAVAADKDRGPGYAGPTVVIVELPQGCAAGSGLTFEEVYSRIADQHSDYGGVLIFDAVLQCDPDGNQILHYSQYLPYPGAGPLEFRWSDGVRFSPLEIID